MDPGILAEFESVAKRLQAQFERSMGVNHPGVKGSVRERALAEDYLRAHLPKRFAIGNGLIVDGAGQKSGEQDLVIYDEFNSAVLQDFGDRYIFFAEQVAVCVEVKSNLTQQNLKQILEQSSKVGKLQKNLVRPLFSIAPLIAIPRVSPILLFGMAYTSSLRLEQIRDELDKAQGESAGLHKPFAMLILSDNTKSAGLIVRVHGSELMTIQIPPMPDSPYAIIRTESQGKALLYYHMILMEALRHHITASPAPDFQAYVQKAGLASTTMELGPYGIKQHYLHQAMETLKIPDQKSDEEIFSAFHYIIKQARKMGIPGVFEEESTFVVNGQPILDLRPSAVVLALEKWSLGQLSDSDSCVLMDFAQRWRSWIADRYPIEVGKLP
jgi:hypothetical protein